MHGPPPDPRQVPAPVGLSEDPWGWGACLALGLALSLLALWRRPAPALRVALFVAGQVVMLTGPLAAHLDRYVYGSYPTVDKQGSLLFYLDGVHVRMLLHPLASAADPAARLIGVHTGHLWITTLFDLALSPWGAMNAQGLLYPALAWYCAWLLLRELSADPRSALVTAFGWGMGLHVFRDLNWYTIEKAAIFWLPLYAWTLLRARARGGWWIPAAGLAFATMSWMNLYLGLVGAALALLGLAAAAWGHLRERGPTFTRLLGALAASAVLVAPLVVWQGWVLAAGPALATPERFVWERAALDGFTLVPLRWNRMELGSALHPLVLAAALAGAVLHRRDARVRFALAAGLVLFLLSLGPLALTDPPVRNPVYTAALAVLPGFWRVAKPEVFFHGTWLLLCGVAAITLAGRLRRRAVLVATWGMMVGTWLALVRAHPAYPGMSLAVETTLAPNWQDRVFTP